MPALLVNHRLENVHHLHIVSHAFASWTQSSQLLTVNCSLEPVSCEVIYLHVCAKPQRHKDCHERVHVNLILQTQCFPLALIMVLQMPQAT